MTDTVETTPQSDKKQPSHTSSRVYLAWVGAALMLLLGFGLRMYDLTDQPIDFHPTRQLRSAIVARGMYYKMLPDADPALREQAINYWYSTGQYEPSILEYLTARVYLMLDGENLWVARVINSIFWVLAGLALFDLARRATSPAAALLALAYFMVLPFAVQASRSFQPDPGMTMWIVLAAYTLYRWSETATQPRKSWIWAILAGLTGGLAVFTKFPAAYMVGAAAVAMVLFTLGWKRFWRNPQVWLMAVIMVTPTLLFYLNRQGRASEYLDSWTIALSHLLLDPSLYVRWLNLVQNLMGMAALVAGLVGVVIARGRYRWLLISLWIGYFLYGLFLPYQMYTHSYYHIQLISVIALSLAPLFELIIERVRIGVDKPQRFWQALFVMIILVALVFTSWLSIAEFSREDYRSEPAHWENIASLLPSDGKIVALTQDYGYPLMYYGWRKVTLWPNRGERTLSSLRGSVKEFEQYLAKRIEGKSYFLITAFGQFNDQPDLKQALAERYPVFAEGDGYLIYDLEQPLNTSSP